MGKSGQTHPSLYPFTANSGKAEKPKQPSPAMWRAWRGDRLSEQHLETLGAQPPVGVGVLAVA